MKKYFNRLSGLILISLLVCSCDFLAVDDREMLTEKIVLNKIDDFNQPLFGFGSKIKAADDLLERADGRDGITNGITRVDRQNFGQFRNFVKALNGLDFPNPYKR